MFISIKIKKNQIVSDEKIKSILDELKDINFREIELYMEDNIISSFTISFDPGIEIYLPGSLLEQHEYKKYISGLEKLIQKYKNMCKWVENTCYMIVNTKKDAFDIGCKIILDALSNNLDVQAIWEKETLNIDEKIEFESCKNVNNKVLCTFLAMSIDVGFIEHCYLYGVTFTLVIIPEKKLQKMFKEHIDELKC